MVYPLIFYNELNNEHSPISVVPPCWALTAIFASASLNNRDAAAVPVELQNGHIYYLWKINSNARTPWGRLTKPRNIESLSKENCMLFFIFENFGWQLCDTQTMGALFMNRNIFIFCIIILALGGGIFVVGCRSYIKGASFCALCVLHSRG